MSHPLQGTVEVAPMSQKGGGSAGQAAMLRDTLFQVYGCGLMAVSVLCCCIDTQ